MRCRGSSSCSWIVGKSFVAQRTATINRLLWRVHELDQPALPRPVRWTLAKHQGTLADWLATQSGLVAELARDELADIIRLTEAIRRWGHASR